MNPFGGGPLDPLNNGAASMERCLVTCTIQIQTVEKQCHACKQASHILMDEQDALLSWVGPA